MKISDLVMRSYGFEGDRSYGIIVAFQPAPLIGNVSEDINGFVVLWSNGTVTYESEFELYPAN